VAKALESENELLARDKGRQIRGSNENGGVQVCLACNIITRKIFKITY
jgi:hypothetical protein